jgi:hypothetical protein
MKSIIHFVQSLGGLHDAKVISFGWQSDEAQAHLVVKDIHSNFEGLLGYKGPKKGSFIFFQASRYSKLLRHSAKPGFC